MLRLPARFALAALAAVAIVPATAASASAANGTVQLTSTTFTTTEGDASAAITVTRSDASGEGQVRYGVWYDRSASPRQDYQPVNGRIDFAPGQSEGTFYVPVTDDSIVEAPETVKVGIYGPHPMSLGVVSRAVLTIQDNDAVAADRDPVNPLGLEVAPTNGDPLQGARFFVDREWGLAEQAIAKYRTRSPGFAAKLGVIADQPETKRFGTWTRDPRFEISTYLQRVQETDPGSIPLAATYRLQHLECGGVSDSPTDVAGYEHWYDQFAAGIGNQRIVLFYEIDALITSKCLSKTGLNRRTQELRYAIDVLSRLPHAVVYVDAGSALAHSPSYIAWMLRRVGVSKIQGFFTNATHQDWTSHEIKYGRKLIKRLGGRPHFVINTSGNGQGPSIPRSRVAEGNSYRCNAPDNGLGPRPTSDVPSKYRHLDGLVWIGNPGRSAGPCAQKLYPGQKIPPTGAFWLQYAIRLIGNANFSIT
ncbi:MAG TPA: glycoside hydrolase family 6 protein [Conexibacter sp.]|jgi:endoglucanase